MTSPCSTPISDELLVAYWAHDLDDDSSARVEEHLFSCASCNTACERIARVAEALRAIIPPVISGAELAQLHARGLEIIENTVELGRPSPCAFPARADVVLHRLRGLDLSSTEELRINIRDEDTGALMMEVLRAPFDRGSGEILIACQRHFRSFPPNVAFEVRARDARGVEQTGRFLVLHAFE
jgi:hypothetical protein